MLFLHRLHHLTSTAWAYIRLRITYPLLIRRRRWLDYSVTMFHAAVFLVFVIINGSLLVPSGRVLRCGTLASVNMVLLFLGGRTSFLVEYLGVALPTYYLAHRWIGVIVIVQGLAHAIMAAVSIKRASPSGTAVSLDPALDISKSLNEIDLNLASINPNIVIDLLSNIVNLGQTTRAPALLMGTSGPRSLHRWRALVAPATRIFYPDSLPNHCTPTLVVKHLRSALPGMSQGKGRDRNQSHLLSFSAYQDSTNCHKAHFALKIAVNWSRIVLLSPIF